MPQPAPGDRHVNSLLTNWSFASIQAASGFVAPKVCPVIRVSKQSDYYALYNDEFFRRNVMKPRAWGAPSAGAGYTVDNTNTYFCDKYATHLDISDDARRNADSVFSLDSEAATFLTNQAMLNMEINFASTIFTTSVWTGSSTGSDITPSTKWDNSSGVPIKDVRTQMRSVKQNCGQTPNVLVCGALAWESIRDNADVIDRTKHTGRDATTPEIAAKLMGLDAIYVADAIQTSSVEGHATETKAYINTSDSALLLYVPKTVGLMTPMGGATFIWTGDSGMGLNEYGAAIKKFRMEELESDRLEINQYFDIKQTGALFGAMFVTVDT